MDAAAPLATLALVLLILVSAVKATRRDPRFDRREIVIQLAWIVVYMLICAGLALGLAPLGRRVGIVDDGS